MLLNVFPSDVWLKNFKYKENLLTLLQIEFQVINDTNVRWNVWKTDRYHKTKVIQILTIKGYSNGLGKRLILPYSPKKIVWYHRPLITISRQKFQDSNWFYLGIIIIQASCNLIQWKTHLVTPNQKQYSQMLLPLDDYLHAPNEILSHITIKNS